MPQCKINNQAVQDLGQILHNWVNSDRFELPRVDNNITFTLGPNGGEMLRVAEDGFYVRGVRVPADADEAATVYRVFREWLVWSQLTRD